jgi:hypothetical protein
MTKADALKLAEYRQSVGMFLGQRQDLEIDRAHALDGDGTSMTAVGSPQANLEEEEEEGAATAAAPAMAQAIVGAAATQHGAHATDDDPPDPVGVARGAAVVLKAQSAGELQAMLGFLEGRTARSEGGEPRLVILSYGVGQPRDEELLMAQDARRQGVPCAIYTLSLKVSSDRRRSAARLGVDVKEFEVFHELLTEVLHSAGLPKPVRELARMADDGATAQGTLHGIGKAGAPANPSRATDPQR